MTRVGDALTRSQGKTALWVTGLVTAIAAGAAVVWGRVKGVDVPRRGEWETPPSVCVVEPASRQLVGDAMGVLREHGIRGGRLLPEGAPCDLRPGLIVVSVDPSLDAERLEDLDEGPTLPGERTRWERVHVVQHENGGPIVQVDLRVHPHAQLTAHVHGLLHAQGYDHPIAAPSGHILHPDRASLTDWRGIP